MHDIGTGMYSMRIRAVRLVHISRCVAYKGALHQRTELTL